MRERRRAMAENWKDARKWARKTGLNDKIKKVRQDHERNEAVIREIETKDVTVFGNDERYEHVDDRIMKVRSLTLFSGDLRIEAEAAVPFCEGDIVRVSLSLRDDWKWVKKTGKKKMSITFKDEHALDAAIAAFKGIYLILKAFRDEDDDNGGEDESESCSD